jgi:hypothetical protein
MTQSWLVCHITLCHSHVLHLPRMQERAMGGFMTFCTSYATSPLPSLPPLHATARRRRIFVTLSEPLTLQGRMAVSIDTRTALARLLG